VAEVALLDQAARGLIVGSAALLGADLHDALVAPGGVDHPAAFADEQRHRLLDKDVLARGARHDGHQRVPVVGAGDADGIDVFVVEQAAEVGIAAGVHAGFGADGFQALLEAGLIDLGEGGEVGVVLAEEVVDMLGADQGHSR
jgi:hypothetical protein